MLPRLETSAVKLAAKQAGDAVGRATRRLETSAVTLAAKKAGSAVGRTARRQAREDVRKAIGLERIGTREIGTHNMAHLHQGGVTQKNMRPGDIYVKSGNAHIPTIRRSEPSRDQITLGGNGHETTRRISVMEQIVVPKGEDHGQYVWYTPNATYPSAVILSPARGQAPRSPFAIARERVENHNAGNRISGDEYFPPLDRARVIKRMVKLLKQGSEAKPMTVEDLTLGKRLWVNTDLRLSSGKDGLTTRFARDTANGTGLLIDEGGMPFEMSTGRLIPGAESTKINPFKVCDRAWRQLKEARV